MVKVPTIAIANADSSDYVVINQSDYVPGQHIPWDEEPEPSFHDYPASDLEESDAQAVADQTEVIDPDQADSEPVAEPDQDAELTARAKELADNKTMTELKAMAKELGISGYSKMNQADITMAIARAEITLKLSPDQES